MTALRKRRFVDGSGRRYIDAAVNGAPQLYGSSTWSMTNSAPAGTSMPMRISPRLSNWLKAARRLPTVDTSAPSQFDPSFVRKIGSSPRDSAKRSWTDSGVMVHPCAGRWHEKHVRPFVPRSLKNGLSTSNAPLTSKVRICPVGSSETS